MGIDKPFWTGSSEIAIPILGYATDCPRRGTRGERRMSTENAMKTTNLEGVVLISGGLDSTILLHHLAAKSGAQRFYCTLSFDYGQRHSRELEMARWQVAQLPAIVEHRVVDMRMLGDLLGDSESALLKTGPEVPELDRIPEADRAQPPTYVPNRNLILLSLAAAFAESRRCCTVYYGAQAHDQYGYWDCTPEFVERANSILALNRSFRVTIKAPFAAMSKAEEVRLGQRLGVNFAKTWSCYRGGTAPCGTCPTCVERRRAFETAGIADPLES